MKLSSDCIKYLGSNDFRVLQGIELGSRNHELVPTQIIHSISGLRSMSSTNKSIITLSKLNLLSKLRNAKYDGYRLTHLGYDFLALKAVLMRDSIKSMGNIIGIGKESDVYLVSDSENNTRVLKIHRLGRTSFRSIKNKRDYLKNKHTSSWKYLSRLSAQKEYEFMTILYENGFNVPKPFDHSRHIIVMEWIDGQDLKKVPKTINYKTLYSDIMNFIVKFANHGLIHCDINEFNILLVSKESDIHEHDFYVIDFPQCVSTNHFNAKYYFDRDVKNVVKFFKKKFNYVPVSDDIMVDTSGYGDGYRYEYPDFERDIRVVKHLDKMVKASGYDHAEKEYFGDVTDTSSLADSEDESSSEENRRNEEFFEKEKVDNVIDNNMLETVVNKINNYKL